MSYYKVIEVCEVSKNYGKTVALDKLSFDVFAGETLGLLGPNGAGKSTFISILTGVCKPTAGDILVKGFSVTKEINKIKKIIGYVPQDIALYPMLSGIDNLNFWASIYGLSAGLRKERIDEALVITRLEDKIKDRVENYSGGMKRRLNIAVALLNHPEIIVLDEPTVGIDILSKQYIFDEINNLKSLGRTVILVSHYIDDMESVCDRIAILKSGSLATIGTEKELLNKFGKNNLEEILLDFIQIYNEKELYSVGNIKNK